MLSVCVLVQNHAPLIPRFLRNVEPIADEIVAVDGGSRDGSQTILRAHPKVRLYERPFDGFVPQRNFSFDKATGDWIFILDIDELVGDRIRDRLPALMRACRKRWYKFPRYWLVSEKPPLYLCSEVHYPDFAIRLFRNIPFFRYTEDRIVHHHFPREGRGPGKKVRDAHVFHLHLLLYDRAQREAKVAAFNRAAPAEAATSNPTYLFEDYAHEVRACEEPLPD